MMIVPVSLLLIMFLLYSNFKGNLKDMLIASMTLPFAFIGGFISLWITNTVFGISAGIGFIILFGVATIDGIVLIGVMRENIQKKMPLREAIVSGVQSRIRPIVMFAIMGSLGLLPAALSTGMESEIHKPLAIMIVGGSLYVCYSRLLYCHKCFTGFTEKRKREIICYYLINNLAMSGYFI